MHRYSLLSFHPGERDYVIPPVYWYSSLKSSFHPGKRDYVIPPATGCTLGF